MHKVLVAGLVLSCLAGAAVAGPDRLGDQGNMGPKGEKVLKDSPWGTPWSPAAPQAAPEIEIASAGAAIALLVGGVIVLRGRKARKRA